MEQQDSLSLAQIVADSASQTTKISLLEMIQQGGWFGGIIILILFLLLLFTVYLFFERYLSINKQSKQDYYFINNIRDFVYESKINAAIELCKRTNTPESRMIEKGLLRIGRPLKEISEAIENTGKLEVYKLEKKCKLSRNHRRSSTNARILGNRCGNDYVLCRNRKYCRTSRCQIAF